MSISQVSQIWSEADPVVWLVTSAAGDASGGLIATFVNQASIAPECPRMLIGLSRQHHTWKLVEASGAFALHLVDEDHVDWVWNFGLQSGWNVNKLNGLSFNMGATGSPLLTAARSWLDCQVEAKMNTGDRTVYLAQVIDAHYSKGAPFLTVQRLLQLAPADKLRLLNELHDRDAIRDAEAIRAWRNQKN